MANNKHLSLSDRITIESMLEKHHTFKEIGSFLDKNPTTISKEIRSRFVTLRPVAGTYSTTTVSYGSPVPKNIFVTPVILPANLNYAEIVPCATPFAMNLSLTPARNTPSRLMFVTAVANAIPVVWKNICTSLKMPTPGTVHFFQNPAPAFPSQKKKSNT